MLGDVVPSTVGFENKSVSFPAHADMGKGSGVLRSTARAGAPSSDVGQETLAVGAGHERIAGLPYPVPEACLDDWDVTRTT